MMMSKYNPGDIVRLKINPKQKVMIVKPQRTYRLDGTEELRYLARCMDGKTEWYFDWELEALPGKQDHCESCPQSIQALHGRVCVRRRGDKCPEENENKENDKVLPKESSS